uniref:Uncharacterized protein n=1 Tax=Panagrolaimus davidi TaxID=227884 RepID=A0A914Q3F1_9BILA
MDNAEYLFNASKVRNPESQIDNLMNDIVSETTEFALQRFVIIVSDQCFSDSLSGNPRFGTESLSMLMLQNDSKKCYSNWPIFIPENITASIQMYSNMDVQFSANPNTTIINFIAVIYKNETIFDFVLNLIKERILSKESLCRNRKFIGAFQIGNNDKKSQKVFTMALPLYFNDDETEWYFEYNLKRAFNNAKQHLEVIVHGKLFDAEYNQTLTLIAPSQYNKSNHWSLFDSDDNFEKFAYYNTICRNNAPSYALMPSFPTTAASPSISYSNTPPTISSSATIMTTSVPVLNTSTKVWWIASFGVGAVILLSIIAAILYRCHRKKQKQRRQFFYKKDIQLKAVATAFEATLSNAFVNDERQKAYIDKNLIQIDQNTILGKGSNAIVYSGLNLK